MVLPTFYQPETKELAFATHNNIRRSMFFAAFRSVKYVEYKHLSNKQDSFDFDRVEKTGTHSEEGYIDWAWETYGPGNEKKDGKLL